MAQLIILNVVTQILSPKCSYANIAIQPLPNRDVQSSLSGQLSRQLSRPAFRGSTPANADSEPSCDRARDSRGLTVGTSARHPVGTRKQVASTRKLALTPAISESRCFGIERSWDNVQSAAKILKLLRAEHLCHTRDTSQCGKPGQSRFDALPTVTGKVDSGGRSGCGRAEQAEQEQEQRGLVYRCWKGERLHYMLTRCIYVLTIVGAVLWLIASLESPTGCRALVPTGEGGAPEGPKLCPLLGGGSLWPPNLCPDIGEPIQWKTSLLTVQPECISTVANGRAASGRSSPGLPLATMHRLQQAGRAFGRVRLDRQRSGRTHTTSLQTGRVEGRDKIPSLQADRPSEVYLVQNGLASLNKLTPRTGGRAGVVLLQMVRPVTAPWGLLKYYMYYAPIGYTIIRMPSEAAKHKTAPLAGQINWPEISLTQVFALLAIKLARLSLQGQINRPDISKHWPGILVHWPKLLIHWPKLLLHWPKLFVTGRSFGLTGRSFYFTGRRKQPVLGQKMAGRWAKPAGLLNYYMWKCGIVWKPFIHRVWQSDGTETSTTVGNGRRNLIRSCVNKTIALDDSFLSNSVGKEYWLQQLNNMFCKEALIQQPGRFCPPASHFLAEHRLFSPAGEVEASAGQSKASAGDEKLRPMK
ncbi:uncharacterized protein B0H18DRAFT_1157331 [Fomitopsis serialis]|uniref:uncharacterized protein n=1 Tax=Fomitopsis serialis TaxID=139415 RepID=UPI002007F0BB|nr:uncharacterized protein B0H18DRAFT_1157331 [Neoantrodia serialis]KAH9912448.1 hypothetical protein B0H18DRAFT_1157331 [Neoantrodia serialis]